MVLAIWPGWWFDKRNVLAAPIKRRWPVFLVALSLSACGGPAIGSIGAVLSRDRHSGAVFIQERPAQQAAARAGLLAGDRLKMVDGILVDTLTKEELLQRLRGPVGSTAKLTILRGGEVLHVELKRGPLARHPTRLPPRHQRVEETSPK